MKKKRVFLTRRLHDFALRELKKKYQIKVHSGKIPIPKSKLLSELRDADGLVCFPYDIIDKKIIDSAPNLKAISTYSVGFDHIDIQYSKEKKIRVGYTPEVLTDATADLAFALMIDVMRRVTEGDRTIRSKKWDVIYGAYDYVGWDLQKKKLGILGLGRIGRTLAKRARAFDMDIIYHNRKRVPRSIEKRLGAKYVSFKRLISDSDVISIHVPHTKQTDKMFNYLVFKNMKKGAFLINTARGKIVDEGDLIRALKKKEIAGAGLDVFETEPVKKSSPLLRLENVVLAPHIGSSTTETREKMAQITVDNLHLGLRGLKPKYSVGY